LALFWPTVHSLVSTWSGSRSFSHGFVVLPSCLYLIWCYRTRLAGVMPTPSRGGLVWLSTSALVWILGNMLEIMVLQQVALVTLLPGLLLTIFGITVTRTLAYPLGILLFAVPTGAALESWLQEFTATFVMTGFQLVGIPALRDGNFITVSTGTWEVARDCAGLRYVLSGMTLGYLYTALAYQRPMRRMEFLLAFLPLLIVANGIRAFGVILTDHLGIVQGYDHRLFSYSVYAMTVFPALWFGLKWREDRLEQPRQASRSRFISENTPVQPLQASYARTALAALYGVGIVALAPLATWLYQIGR
jgi:exosortase A